MKLKLTEIQYNNLLNYVNETTFDVSVRHNIKKDDIISIVFNDNTTNNFKVIESNNGNIIMDNIDAKSTNINYRYFFSMDDLTDNVLNLKRIHKYKQVDLLDQNPTEWNNFSIKNIKLLRIFNKSGIKKDEIDIIKPPLTKEPKFDKKIPNYKELNTNILKKISNELHENEAIIFKLADGSDLTLCVQTEHNYTYNFNVIDIKGNRHKFDFLKENNIILKFNESEGQNELDEIIRTKNKGKIISLKLNLVNKVDNKEKQYYLDFTDYKLIGKCEDWTKGQEEKQQNRKDKEKQQTKEMMDMILSDPLLKKTFLHVPKLFGLIKIGDPVGIIPAEKLLNNYKEKQIKNNLGEKGEKFIPDNRLIYQFVLDKPIDIILGKDKLNLNNTDKYIARVKRPNYKDKNIILISSTPRFKLSIIEDLKKDDLFKATLSKDFINNSGIREFYKTTVTIRIRDYNY